MKYILTLFLFITTTLAFGQNSVDFGQLIKSWTQGKIDQNGKVIQADINRGGWYQLNINPDSTVIFGDPFTCGFGHERYGIWTLNRVDTTVTFSFSKRVGYMNSPGTVDIKEIEVYKIKKLNTGELILTRTVDGEEMTMPFVVTKK
ncbi:MAG: hypothetical protein NT040_02905 [Bacteroidetes bacterium]|nr:hypothetical protein [Bacteroidota bacterium]